MTKTIMLPVHALIGIVQSCGKPEHHVTIFPEFATAKIIRVETVAEHREMCPDGSGNIFANPAYVLITLDIDSEWDERIGVISVDADHPAPETTDASHRS